MLSSVWKFLGYRPSYRSLEPFLAQPPHLWSHFHQVAQKTAAEATARAEAAESVARRAQKNGSPVATHIPAGGGTNTADADAAAQENAVLRTSLEATNGRCLALQVPHVPTVSTHPI